jgi:hypothetical protein
VVRPLGRLALPFIGCALPLLVITCEDTQSATHAQHTQGNIRRQKHLRCSNLHTCPSSYRQCAATSDNCLKNASHRNECALWPISPHSEYTPAPPESAPRFQPVDAQFAEAGFDAWAGPLLAFINVSYKASACLTTSCKIRGAHLQCVTRHNTKSISKHRVTFCCLSKVEAIAQLA